MSAMHDMAASANTVPHGMMHTLGIAGTASTPCAVHAACADTCFICGLMFTAVQGTDKHRELYSACVVHVPCICVICVLHVHRSP